MSNATPFKRRGHYQGPAALFVDANGRPKAIIVADSMPMLEKAWLEVTGVRLIKHQVQLVNVTTANEATPGEKAKRRKAVAK